MKKISILLATIIVAFFAGLQSCSKAGEGTVGPAGPAGATGPAGPAGAAGANGGTGAQGQAGTANVLYSDWLDLIPNKLPSRETTITAPRITQNVIDNSDVRVYIRIGVNNVFPLPYSDLTYWLLLGKITIQVAGNSTINTGIKIRYVIIPGGTSIGAGRKAAPEVDLNDYQAIKTYYNLKD